MYFTIIDSLQQACKTKALFRYELISHVHQKALDALIFRYKTYPAHLKEPMSEVSRRATCSTEFLQHTLLLRKVTTAAQK